MDRMKSRIEQRNFYYPHNTPWWVLCGKNKKFIFVVLHNVLAHRAGAVLFVPDQ